MRDDLKLKSIVRCARNTEWRSVADVILSANPHLESRITKFLKSGGYWHAATPVVCETDGQIASCAVLFHRQVWVGQETARVGGIGAVATVPAARGKGYATSVLQYCQDFLRTQGYRLGVLFCTIVDFYQPLGWSCVEEDWVEFTLGGSCPLSAPRGYRLAQVSAVSFSEQASLLYNQTPESSAGAVVRPDGLWQEYQNWQREDIDLFWGAFDGDRLVAYVRGRRAGSDVLLQEITCLHAHRAVLPGLLEAQRGLVRPSGPVTFHAYLSRQHSLIDSLKNCRVRLTWRKTAADTSTMMIKPLGPNDKSEASHPAGERFLTAHDFETRLPWWPRSWWAIDRF
jgi:GNAT superfamily N-acetyltransferase